MSEPKLISPMLDGFAMGEPISDHHGVRCCPAMPNGTNDRYIVKIISIPASQVQLDALLLTGAYRDEASALAYFKELADGVVSEVDILNKLSRLEGFLPYKGCQIVPMENAVGYDVYLLSPYKRSLERHFRKETMTHLAAVNLGLDMCAALAVCRHSGYLYADLKPGNIFISDDNEYRIGDIGFLRLDSLRYASLPDKYRSAYTAPEITDAFSAINTTIDVYAAGLILYQAYNGGVLPFEGQAPVQELPAPVYADYEMAEIILKACSPDPATRWQDPIQMGQALVSYMQRNGANDTPIVPLPVEYPAPAPDFEPEPAEEPPIVTEEELAIPEGAEIPEEGDQLSMDELLASAAVLAGVEASTATAAEEDAPSVTEEAPVAPAFPCPEVGSVSAEDAEVPVAAVIAEEPDPADLGFMDTLVSDETAPGEETAEAVSYAEISVDTGDILAQADDLIAHEAPDPVVAPAPIEIPVPEPIVLPPDEEAVQADSVEPGEPIPASGEAESPESAPEESEEDDEAVIAALLADAPVEPEESEASEAAAAEEVAQYSDEALPPEKKRGSGKKILGILLAVFLLAALVVGGYFFYNEYYIQTIDAINVSGEDNRLTVVIDTETDESILRIVCIDDYGNKKEAPVANGTATFVDLNYGTNYTVKVEIKGLHKVVGAISGKYKTPAETKILDLTAMTGSGNGTVILTFTPDGAGSDNWLVRYSTPGEAEQTKNFTGPLVTLEGLTVGSTYTFTIESPDGLYITGDPSVSYTVSNAVLAQNARVTSCSEEGLVVRWDVPEGENIASWTVRCYSKDAGYDQKLTVSDTTALFQGINPTAEYTIHITAENMTEPATCYVSANSVTITELTATPQSTTELKVDFSFTGPTPEDPWLIMYSVAGSEYYRLPEDQIITNFVPGAVYSFTIQLENSPVTVLSDTLTVELEAAQPFAGYMLTPDNMTFSMCATPDVVNWNRFNVSSYGTSYSVGDKASFVVYSDSKYGVSNDLITVMYVIYNEDGHLVSWEFSEPRAWRSMWYQRYCELDIPSLPDTPGEYTLEVYFNGGYVHTQEFTVTES